MDLSAIIKAAGADKPKQTRPHDARWQHNAVQYRTTYDAGESWSPWHFWNFDGHVSMASCPKEWDFVEGRKAVERLQQEHDSEYVQFRLVSINEVI